MVDQYMITIALFQIKNIKNNWMSYPELHTEPCNCFLQFQPFPICLLSLHFNWDIATLDKICLSIDQSSSTILISLDHSVAFDKIDHLTLVDRIRSSFGITGAALSWFQFYLVNRNQFVCIDTSSSSVISWDTCICAWSICFYPVHLLLLAVLSDITLHKQQYSDDMLLCVATSRRTHTSYLIH